MTQPIREQLLGYLLGALDDAERDQIEAALRRDPELQTELETLAEQLSPLEEARDETDPPPGLAERTCELIDAYDDVRRASQPTNLNRELRRRPQWRTIDVVTVIGICIASLMLFFPVIAQSRHASQITHCQNNLREIGNALLDYAGRQGDFFPTIPEDDKRGVAGIYAPVLLETQFLTETDRLICPGSPLAWQSANWRMPRLVELDQAEGQQLIVLQRSLGGSYGYNLGMMIDGRYFSARCLGRSQFALLADSPRPGVWAIGASPFSENHGHRGQNVLFEDGHVVFLTNSLDDGLDHPFLNRRGEVAAGVDADDAVIGESAVSPFGK